MTNKQLDAMNEKHDLIYLSVAEPLFQRDSAKLAEVFALISTQELTEFQQYQAAHLGSMLAQAAIRESYEVYRKTPSDLPILLIQTSGAQIYALPLKVVLGSDRRRVIQTGESERGRFRVSNE